MQDKFATYEPVDSAVWNTRLDSLQQAIRNFRSTLATFRQSTLDASGQPIHGFALVFQRSVDAMEGYLTYVFRDYFWTGFNKAGFEEDADYPREYVLERTLAQASSDLAILNQLWGKAVTDQVNQSAKPSPGAQVDLAAVQRLALKALEPAIACRLIDAITVLPYYRKAPNVRTIPYAPIAFMGVPYTSIMVHQDLLAIPHETGHHVYWRGRLPGKSEEPGQPIWLYLHQQMRQAFSFLAADEKDLTPPQKKQKEEEKQAYVFAEEIFADVYGCLIAGPTIALSAQDLQLAAPTVEFEGGDSEHPTPRIRPLIYGKVLAAKGAAEWAEKLNLTWTERVAEREERIQPGRGLNVVQGGADRTADQTSPLVEEAHLSPSIEFVIAQCLKVLAELETDNVAPWGFDAGPSENGAPNPARLFEAFSKRLQPFLAQRDFQEFAFNPISLPEPAAQVREWERLAENEKDAAPNTPLPKWRYVFENGWADKGPHGRH